MPQIAMVIDPWFHFNGTVVSTRRFVAADKTVLTSVLIAGDPNDPSDNRCIGFVPLRIPGINSILDRMKAPSVAQS